MRMGLLIMSLLACAVGCKSVHLEGGGGVPIAILPRNAKDVSEAELTRRVAESLKLAGIESRPNDSGIAIAPAFERKAREALLVDAKLADLDIGVVLLVPPGGGRVSERGLIVSSVGPASTSEITEVAEPTEPPTSEPSTQPTTGAVIDTDGSDDDGPVIVLVWRDAAIAAAKKQPIASLPQLAEIETRLADAGLHPIVVDYALGVPVSEAKRARELFVAGPALEAAELWVVLFVPAGSGRAADGGFDVPNRGLEVDGD